MKISPTSFYYHQNIPITTSTYPSKRLEGKRSSVYTIILCFLEFLNTWNDFPDLRNRQVTDTVLVLYSVSVLQFAVVTTKTTDEYQEEITEDDQNLFGEEPRTRTDTNGNLVVSMLIQTSLHSILPT